MLISAFVFSSPAFGGPVIGFRLAVGGTFTSIANMITGVSGKTGGAFITTPMANKYNFGLIGSSVNTTLVSSGRSYGVMGSAGNCTSGYN